MWLEKLWFFYFSNVWWDHIPDANCSGVKTHHCSVDAAPGSYVMATVFDHVRTQDVAISFRCDFATYNTVISKEAYRRLDFLFMSFTYSRQRTGPRIEPCGTPDVCII